jgi:alkaline phosphatase D
MVTKLNYGLISINWAKKPLTATVSINGDNQATYLTQEIPF